MIYCKKTENLHAALETHHIPPPRAGAAARVGARVDLVEELGGERAAVRRRALEVEGEPRADGEEVAHHHKVHLLARRDARQVHAVQSEEAAEQREAVLHQVRVVVGQRRHQEGGLALAARLQDEAEVGRVEEERARLEEPQPPQTNVMQANSSASTPEATKDTPKRKKKRNRRR